MTETTTDITETIEPELPKRDPVPVLDKAPISKKPTYMVVDGQFYAQLSDGEMKVPLILKTNTIRKLQKEAPEEEIDQLFFLLQEIGDTDGVERLGELDFFETTEFALKFFQAWEEKNEARLGELRRSSRS